MPNANATIIGFLTSMYATPQSNMLVGVFPCKLKTCMQSFEYVCGLLQYLQQLASIKSVQMKAQFPPPRSTEIRDKG